MKVNKWHLQRLVWTIQKRLDDEFENIPIDVLAKEISDGVVIYFRGEVLGQRKSAKLNINAPDGLWQYIKAAFGFAYRRKQFAVTAYQLFPDLQLPLEQKTIVYIEGE